MEKGKRKPLLLVAGVLFMVLALGAAVMLAAGAAVVFAQTTDTPAAPEVAPESPEVEQTPTEPAERGFVHPYVPGMPGVAPEGLPGGFPHGFGEMPDKFSGGPRGFGSLPEGLSSNDELLAEALGIDLETLQSAYADVQAALLDEAVAAGILTEEQATAMLERGFGFHGRGSFGFHGFEARGFAAEDEALSFDHEAALAEALGVSATELQEARQAARLASLAELVAAEVLSQEQVDFMLAAEAFNGSLDRDALTAEALGISVAELEAAREEGKSLATLIEELGLTTTEVQDALQAGYEAAVQQAISDGILTPEQGAQLLDSTGFGPCGRGDSGRSGFHGQDFHHGGRMPGMPGGAGEDTFNPFGAPGRGMTNPFAGLDA